MRKIKILFVAIFVIALAGCQVKAPVNQSTLNGNGTPALNVMPGSAAEPAAVETVAPNGELIEIREKMFVAQTNDVYYNAEDYLGKTLKYEGIFSAYTEEETGTTYYSVFRYGPGCCGIDANCGFEVIWNNEYPEPDDWVEAVGVLETYGEAGQQYLRLALTALTVLDVRGADYVTQ
jgi:uncharacterized membrane protein YcgQ (UPF0703/DUF1980 family)